MRKILLVACLFLTFSVFSQNENEDTSKVPSSIFAVYSLKCQPDNEGAKSLNLTGHKFLITDLFNGDLAYNSINVDLRNIDRHTSIEDAKDNYDKALLNSYDVSRNNDHFIWTMWDTRIQKQWQQDLEKSKN